MGLLQKDPLLVTVSSNKGWARSHRGLLQQPGSSSWLWETMAHAHLCHPWKALVCSVLSSVTFHLTKAVLDAASLQQPSWAQVRRQGKFLSSKIAAMGGRLRTCHLALMVMLKQRKYSLCKTQNSNPDHLVGCWLNSSLYAGVPSVHLHCLFHSLLWGQSRCHVPAPCNI